jgi:hypothetical protein
MDDWLWRDDVSGLALRSGTEDEADSLELWLGDERLTALEPAVARALSDALRVWTERDDAGFEPPPTVVPAGTWFQVYFRPEYEDASGEAVELAALGEARSDGAYLLDASDLTGVRVLARSVGQALATAHKARTGESYGPEMDERARAWISVFRMPEDVRIWKGYWDDLDGVTDDELLAFAPGKE